LPFKCNLCHYASEADPKTHKGYNLDALTSRELFAKFGLEANTVDFVGHAVGSALPGVRSV
jgi:RAB protein geranylgeranyltransferase component A